MTTNGGHKEVAVTTILVVSLKLAEVTLNVTSALIDWLNRLRSVSSGSRSK